MCDSILPLELCVTLWLVTQEFKPHTWWNGRMDRAGPLDLCTWVPSRAKYRQNVSPLWKQFH